MLVGIKSGGTPSPGGSPREGGMNSKNQRDYSKEMAVYGEKGGSAGVDQGKLKRDMLAGTGESPWPSDSQQGQGQGGRSLQPHHSQQGYN